MAVSAHIIRILPSNLSTVTNQTSTVEDLEAQVRPERWLANPNIVKQETHSTFLDSKPWTYPPLNLQA